MRCFVCHTARHSMPHLLVCDHNRSCDRTERTIIYIYPYYPQKHVHEQGSAHAYMPLVYYQQRRGKQLQLHTAPVDRQANATIRQTDKQKEGPNDPCGVRQTACV